MRKQKHRKKRLTSLLFHFFFSVKTRYVKFFILKFKNNTHTHKKYFFRFPIWYIHFFFFEKKKIKLSWQKVKKRNTKKKIKKCFYSLILFFLRVIQLEFLRRRRRKKKCLFFSLAPSLIRFFLSYIFRNIFKKRGAFNFPSKNL